MKNLIKLIAILLFVAILVPLTAQVINSLSNLGININNNRLTLVFDFKKFTKQANPILFSTPSHEPVSEPIPVLTPAFTPVPTIHPNTVHGWDGISYQYVLFGNYPITSINSKNPILWRILDVTDSKALLLSEYVLCKRKFNEKNAAVWEESTLRAWLNEVFFTGSFTPEMQDVITPNTKEFDYVFLLEDSDYCNPKYGFSESEGDDAQRIARLASYQSSKITIGLPCPYYGRTSRTETSLTQVRVAGSLGQAKYNRDDVGVRPAIWIDLNQITFIAGDGTINSPYQISENHNNE